MNDFLKNTYKNVPWVTIIESKKQGKNIWIFAITHWNEPVGLDVFHFLINDFWISSKLKTWKIFLIAINIEAYKQFLDYKKTELFRFIDDNMNRITNKIYNSMSNEHNRFQELKTIFDEIDIVIDLHSVSKWNDIIWITDKKYINSGLEFFDVETILVDDIGKTWAIIWYFLRQNKEAYWLECWNHVSSDGKNQWIKNVCNFLIYKWCIDGDIVKTIIPTIFEFFKEIIPKTNYFQYIKNFLWFSYLRINEIYAIDGEKQLINNYWSDVYIWLVAKEPILWDWAGFLFKKITSPLWKHFN